VEMENICHRDEKVVAFVRSSPEAVMRRCSGGLPSVEAGGSSSGSMGKELVLWGNKFEGGEKDSDSSESSSAPWTSG
jgi:hypothetical protein